MNPDRAQAARAVLGRFHMPRTIRTERLQLGPFDMTHEPAFRRFFASEAARYIGGPAGPILAWRTFASYTGQWFVRGFGMYALTTRDGEFAGYCGIWFPENKPEIELGWGIFPQFQGRGYATEAARAIRAIAIGQGVPSLVSYIAPENRASSAVAKRLGAKMDGTVVLGPHTVEVWRHAVPTPERVPEPADILLETNVMPLSVGSRRLTMAPMREEHFERYAAHEGDETAQRYAGGVSDRYAAWRKFVAAAGQWALRGYGMYAVEHDGVFVGRVGLYHPPYWPERELGWHIHVEAQRQGFATEAAAAVRAVAVEQGLRRLVSYIHPENVASLGVARRLGAVDTGRANLPLGDALRFEHPMTRTTMEAAA